MQEKIQFFPISIGYKVIDDHPVIHIYGKAIDGRHVLVLDYTFLPYFYVIPKKGADIREKLLKLELSQDGRVSRVLKAESMQKKLIGRPVEAIKVTTGLPRDIPLIRGIIKDWDAVEGTYEYDILFYRRYLIDRGITPLILHEAEVEPANLRSKVAAYKAIKIESLGTDSLKPKILAFDIETYNPDCNIDPEKNPIIMVSFHSENFSKVIVSKRFRTSLDYVEFVNSESELIQKFKETVEHFRPDIIAGYYSDGFDLPYLKARATKYKLSLDLGYDFSEISITGKEIKTASITGFCHLDVFKFVKRILGPGLDTDGFGLNAVAKELLGENKVAVDLNKLCSVWDSSPEELDRYCAYNLTDSMLAYKLAQKLMPIITEMVKIVGLPPDDVTRMGFSQLVEWYLLRQAPNFNEIAPNKPGYGQITERKRHSYEGGFVFEPRPGLYRDIVVFDYRSLYPTIIGSHNISPDTLDCSCCMDSAKKTPEEGYWFCTKKKGFIPALIEDLITRRMRIKEIIKESSEEKHVLLDARQNSLKLLANSFYGYLGFFGSRWYSLESAKATTAWGRYYIKDVIKRAQDIGFNVLYSDTDSVFLALEGKSVEDAHIFADKINARLPGLMELEYEGFYPSGIFVSSKASEYGAKKKYALLSASGSLKIRGFETVRRNCSMVAKETQEKIIGIILREHDKIKALDYVKGVISSLRAKTVPIEKVIIHTQLQKGIDEYTSKGPHVAVAERLRSKGIETSPGSIIQFVVTQGMDIISKRAKLPEEVKQEDYDADYYINNQVVPAVETIFRVLGYSKDDIIEHKEQRKLGRFF